MKKNKTRSVFLLSYKYTTRKETRMDEPKNEIEQYYNNDGIIHQEPSQELLWFQNLVKQDQKQFTVNKTKARQILEYILRRMKNE